MTSPTQLKILSAIWRSPRLSRSDLEDLTGFHANTVARTVEVLLRKGYLREGEGEVTLQRVRGRPRIPLEIDPARICVGGLAIGASAIEAVTMNLFGQPLAKVVQIPTLESEQISRTVTSLLRGLLRANPIALGVSVTGFVDPERLRILFSSATPFGELDLAPIFKRAGDIPVVLNSEMHALGIRWMMGRAESQEEDVIVVKLEDGAVGASLLLGGSPNKGCLLGGSELGHMRLGVETERCYCGGVGCVERIFSTAFLHQCGGSGTLTETFSKKTLDPSALKIVTLMAQAFVNATVFARPHRIVVVGSLAQHVGFRTALETSWRNQLPDIFKSSVTLEWGALDVAVSAETAGWLAIASVLRGELADSRPPEGISQDPHEVPHNENCKT